MIRAGCFSTLVVLISCGAKVDVDGAARVDVCACWAVRQTEAHTQPQTLGPCLQCWAQTIIVHGDRNGICHDDQQRCLLDAGCEAALACVTPCGDAACVNQCLASASSQPSLDLFLDWSRCFCVECGDACSGAAGRGECAASHL